MDSYSFIYYNIIFTNRGNNMTDSKNPIIGVVMGSDSDWPIMKLATEMLNDFNVPYESKIVSELVIILVLAKLINYNMCIVYYFVVSFVYSIIIF